MSIIYKIQHFISLMFFSFTFFFTQNIENILAYPFRILEGVCSIHKAVSAHSPSEKRANK